MWVLVPRECTAILFISLVLRVSLLQYISPDIAGWPDGLQTAVQEQVFLGNPALTAPPVHRRWSNSHWLGLGQHIHISKHHWGMRPSHVPVIDIRQFLHEDRVLPANFDQSVIAVGVVGSRLSFGLAPFKGTQHISH